jgi:glucose/arabinose dehydrogenase
MTRLLLRSALAALVALLVACSDTYVTVPTAPTPLQTSTPQIVTTKIEFRAAGTPSQVRLRYSSPADGLAQVVTTLPYTASFATSESTLFLSLEGTATVSSFSLFPFFSVQIVVNGNLFREATSTDAFVTSILASGTWRR